MVFPCVGTTPNAIAAVKMYALSEEGVAGISARGAGAPLHTGPLV